MCSAPGRCGRCSRWAQVASPGQPRCPPPPGSPWTLRLCSCSSDCPGALPYLSRLGHQRPPLPQQPPAPPLPCEDPEGPGKAPGLSPLIARSDAGTSSYRPHPSRVSLLPALLGPGPPAACSSLSLIWAVRLRFFICRSGRAGARDCLGLIGQMTHCHLSGTLSMLLEGVG